LERRDIPIEKKKGTTDEGRGRTGDRRKIKDLFFPFSLGDCVAIGEMVKNVMLNLFQHLIESTTYETLK
jgi:hypothetical protein